MRRLNLEDVPDEVYDLLAAAAEADHRSLNAFVVERLVEAARVAQLGAYLEAYAAPGDTGISLGEAVATVRAARDAS